MWRDRTNLYLSFRQSYTHQPSKRRRYGDSSNGFAAPESEETRGLMSRGAFEDDGDAVIEMDLLPPRWMDVRDEVSDILKDITLKAAKLDKLHSKHVLPGFDDEDVKAREEMEIEGLTQEITRGFQDCRKAIQRIERMVKEARQSNALQKGDEVMAGNIQTALASRVQEVSAAFRKKQSTYLNKLRQLGGFESPAGPGRSGTPVQNPYTDPALIDADTDASFSRTTLQQSAQKQLRSNDTAIAQREQEINDIAKGIIELADIFRDLQGMVIDQGTMLDRIDYNVERMATDVKGAEKELIVATNYQKKYTKRKVILLLILVILGLFVLLLVKPRSRNEAPPPTSPAADPAGDKT
ncbi:t-SNARE affecting a late Golgi compartment protein 2 [Exophiala xenobiotica]|uniref:t-SNARE affecting a late Golgi compartment protein 2 n=1 Tax=Lithohypha guttulata TaxID=1690604 RepID=A0ABR0KKN3_9EURO|nr:t-SNARE affecting a late Golgi compartment protein 2 [Lithohypha guttulata]KAK5324658.1 t-SNARE affecting a late Golgi compartment protein 2 [Exophiala xenobiotica]